MPRTATFLALAWACLHVPSAAGQAVPDEAPRLLPPTTVSTGRPPLGSIRSLPSTVASPEDPIRPGKELRAALLDPGFPLESIGAGIGAHLEDEPASWPKGLSGLFARVGSHTGAALLGIGVKHGLGAGLRLHVRFRPRGYGGVGARLRHALVGTVTARRPGGARVPHFPAVAGEYSAALAQIRWERGVWRPGQAALSTVLSLGVDALVNISAEFLERPSRPDSEDAPP